MERKNTRFIKLAKTIKENAESCTIEREDGYRVYATEKHRLIEIYDKALYSVNCAKYEKTVAEFFEQSIIFTSI